jgi:hypothetical protein
MKRGEDVMIKTKNYVLKDDKGNYVGVNSISYDEILRRNIYSWSERLINGFYTYSDKSEAMKELCLLQRKGIKIKYGVKFHVEEINQLEIIKKENKIGNSLGYPFKYQIIEEESIAPLEIHEEIMYGVGS